MITELESKKAFDKLNWIKVLTPMCALAEEISNQQCVKQSTLEFFTKFIILIALLQYSSFIHEFFFKLQILEHTLAKRISCEVVPPYTELRGTLPFKNW